MTTQNQGGTSLVQHTLSYDNPTYVTRQSATLTVNGAGSAATTGKFYAWTQLVIYGVTFCTIAAGTSTYTVNGTATNPATQFSLAYITNTNTTGTAVTLGTTTVGPFTIGGTATTGTNVSVGGAQGGIAGGWQGPYAFNTLGGTNTTQVWGTQTFTASPPGGNNAGQGGLPMNPGDSLIFVGGTDATATVIPIVQYGVQPPTGVVLV
jgi:hypothetical protein